LRLLLGPLRLAVGPLGVASARLEEDLVALLVGLLDTPLRQFLLRHRLGNFDALRGEVREVLHFLGILVVRPDALRPPQSLVRLL